VPLFIVRGVTFGTLCLGDCCIDRYTENLYENIFIMLILCNIKR
jgi:hypothetical protein